MTQVTTGQKGLLSVFRYNTATGHFEGKNGSGLWVSLLDAPFRLSASTPAADSLLNIQANRVETEDGTVISSAPSGSTLQAYPVTTINFATGAVTGGTVVRDGGTFALPAYASGQYCRVFFVYQSTLNQINCTFSVNSGTYGGLADPGVLFASLGSSNLPIGYIDLQSVGSSIYKTADSTSTVIENKNGTGNRIFRFGSGAGGGSSGAGASLLDPNFDETFIYYTRSDFSIDQKTFFGSTTGTDNVLGTGKVVLDATQNFISANLLGPVFLADNPVINTAQVRLLYNVGKVDNTFTFTVTASTAYIGDIYTNGYYNYTVLANITGGTTLSCSGNGFMGSSGTLTKVSGNVGSSATIAYSACVFVAISVSSDGGTGYTAATNTYISGRFVVADFTEETGTTSTDYRIKVISNTAASELAGFGVNLVQDSTGAYAGDATFETRIITATEASTGLITLTTVKFTPGAHQLHVIYNGHDFVAPTFLEIGGGVVQFPINFFTAGDTVYFYVAYGLVNTTTAPITINNMLSSNSTLGSFAVPSGYTLDKPWMEIPAGATISGPGNVETTGVITGAGTLATSGTVLSTGKAPTQPVYDTVTTNASIKAGTGILLPSGGIPALLDWHSKLYTSVTFSSAAGTGSTQTAVWMTRISNMVTVRIAAFNVTLGGTASFIVCQMPTTLGLPPNYTQFPVFMKEAGGELTAPSQGVQYASGRLDIYKTVGGATFASGVSGAAWDFCFSYLV